MEGREVRMEMCPSKKEEEAGKKRDCGGLPTAEHQVPTKPPCHSPSSAEQGTENMLKGILLGPCIVFVWQGFVPEGLRCQHEQSLGQELIGGSPEEKDLGVLLNKRLDTSHQCVLAAQGTSLSWAASKSGDSES